jgi:hypothetical protein
MILHDCNHHIDHSPLADCSATCLGKECGDVGLIVHPERHRGRLH